MSTQHFSDKIIEEMNQAIIIADREHKTVVTNSEFYRTFGKTDGASEYIGNDYLDVWKKLSDSFVNSNDFYESIQSAIASKSTKKDEDFVLKTGRILTRCHAPIFIEQKYEGCYCLLTDKTEQNRLEKIIETQRSLISNNVQFTKLGKMTAEIAHEIKNPLTVIQGKAHILSRLSNAKALDDKKIQTFSQDIQTAVDRISMIAKKLTQFARGTSEDDAFEKFELTGLIHDTVFFCKGRLSELGAQLRLKLETRGAEIKAQRMGVSQVLLNLLCNACDAIKDQPDKWIEIETRGDYFWDEILITDSGRGIDPSIEDKIFEPFFTTKKADLGTGLGLSLSKDIMLRQKGELYLDKNSPNTRFVMRFPKPD